MFLLCAAGVLILVGAALRIQKGAAAGYARVGTEGEDDGEGGGEYSIPSYTYGTDSGTQALVGGGASSGTCTCTCPRPRPRPCPCPPTIALMHLACTCPLPLPFCEGHHALTPHTCTRTFEFICCMLTLHRVHVVRMLISLMGMHDAWSRSWIGIPLTCVRC